MIYFVQATKGGAVKIGCSGNVARRVAVLQGYYGRKLLLLATMPGGFPRESEIHEMFSHLRFDRTEQFRPESDLMGFIGRPERTEHGVAEPIKPVDIRVTIQIPMTREFYNWLFGAVDFKGIPLEEFLYKGLVLYAKSHGFTERAPSYRRSFPKVIRRRLVMPAPRRTEARAEP